MAVFNVHNVCLCGIHLKLRDRLTVHIISLFSIREHNNAGSRDSQIFTSKNPVGAPDPLGSANPKLIDPHIPMSLQRTLRLNA